MKELLLIAAGFACLAANGANAQPRSCENREHVLNRLSDAYGESRQTIGLGPNNQVIETYANLNSGSWTVVVTTANGRTCLVASGKSFELVGEETAPLGKEKGA